MTEPTELIELEMRIAHQDRIIADLDEVVREFADRVIALERELKDLRETLSAEDDRGNETPPHY